MIRALARSTWRIPTALLLASILAVAAAAQPSRPASGSRGRKSSSPPPAPPPPPPTEWTTETGPRRAAPGPAREEPPPEVQPSAPEPEAEPPPPPAPDPLFDDRPTGSFEPVTWMHQPSGSVVSTEMYTEEACTRLLADPSLPAAARASLLGGRARARMRMWRLDAARADIQDALALDPRAAPLRLVHAEILACHGRTDEADTVLQDAFILDPESTFSARVLGLLRFQQGSLEAAAEALQIHLAHVAEAGTAAGDATLPLLHAIAANDTGALTPAVSPEAAWVSQLSAFLSGGMGRAELLERARAPRGATPDEAACTAWFYLAHRSLARGERDRATLDFLAAIRTGCTAVPEYRLAVAALIRLQVLRAESLPGRLAQ